MNGNSDRLLRIKSEANDITYSSFVLGLFAMTGFAVSCFSLLLNVLKNRVPDINLEHFGDILTIILIVLLGIMIHKMLLIKNANKWQKYVRVAIDEHKIELKESAINNESKYL